MSNLISSVMVEERVTEVPFLDFDDVILNIRYINREELLKIRNSAMKSKLNRRTGQREEELDEDKFLEAYAKKVIAGWSGLKIKHLPMLLPVDLTNQNLEKPIPYNESEALDLLKNSSVFDQYVSSCMNDLEIFQQELKETEEKN